MTISYLNKYFNVIRFLVTEIVLNCHNYMSCCTRINSPNVLWYKN